MKIFRTLLLAALVLLPSMLATAPVSADPGVTTGAVDVRAGPGTRFRVIARLRQGEVVDIVRCENAWCFVSYAQNSSDGWVNQRYVAAVDLPGKKPRVYRDPSYDRFDGPFFDHDFCERFWPHQPPGCGYFGPGPFPSSPPFPPPHWPGTPPSGGYCPPFWPQCRN